MNTGHYFNISNIPNDCLCQYHYVHVGLYSKKLLHKFNGCHFVFPSLKNVQLERFKNVFHSSDSVQCGCFEQIVFKDSTKDTDEFIDTLCNLSSVKALQFLIEPKLSDCMGEKLCSENINPFM